MGGGGAGFSLSAGLIPALIVGAVTLIVGVAMARRYGEYTTYSAIGLAAAVFSASFAVLNVALQLTAIDGRFLTGEIASGRLALRVTSVVVLVAFLHIILALRSEEAEPMPWSWDLYSEFEEWHNRAKGWPLALVASQATLLVFALAMIWSFTISGSASLIVVVLNWSFAFICDDFFLAASYRRKLGVPPPVFDKWRIFTFRLAVVVLLLTATISEYADWVAYVVIGVIVFFYIMVPARRWWNQGGRLALESIGVMPESYSGIHVKDLKDAVVRLEQVYSDVDRYVVLASQDGAAAADLSEITGYSRERVDALLATARTRRDPES